MTDSLTHRPSEFRANELWGGRFEQGPSAIMREINVSIDFDRRLAVEDIEASRAHVRMLREQLIINREDAQSILGGLDRKLLQFPHKF